MFIKLYVKIVLYNCIYYWQEQLTIICFPKVFFKKYNFKTNIFTINKRNALSIQLAVHPRILVSS